MYISNKWNNIISQQDLWPIISKSIEDNNLVAKAVHQILEQRFFSSNKKLITFSSLESLDNWLSSKCQKTRPTNGNYHLLNMICQVLILIRDLQARCYFPQVLDEELVFGEIYYYSLSYNLVALTATLLPFK